jgi:hypothetical protein
MSSNGHTPRDEATFTVKAGLAEMLKGGVIMDVVTPEEAKIAEDAGAAAVMALERVPSDIRRDGGVARMSDPEMITGIQEAVSIPVMAKARIGHFAEAQVLEALEVDYIDESEVLTPADEVNHIDKWAFKVPFVCGATNLGEALRRIGEGAAMIRSKGEAGTGDIVNAVTHLRKLRTEIRWLTTLGEEELPACRSCSSARAASPLRLTRRWSCSWGRRVFLSGPASSSPKIPPAGLARSSRPPRTTSIPRVSRRRQPALVRPWTASRPPSSTPSTSSQRAAGELSDTAGRRPRPPGRLRRAREGIAATWRAHAPSPGPG